MTFITIGFPTGNFESNVIPVVTIDQDIAAALRDSGANPGEFNRMRWPLGASNYACCKVLMHKAELDALRETSPLFTARKFLFGSIRFDRMFVRPPKPIVIGWHSSNVTSHPGVLYACDVVDERYFWQRDATNLNGFNLSLDDKAELYDSTENGDDANPYTIKEAVEAMIGELSATLAEFSLSALAGPDTVLRDAYAKGMSIPTLIDRFLALENPGYVLAAYPTTDYHSSTTGFRYRAIAIQDGIDGLETLLNDHDNDLLAGGAIAPPMDGTPDSVIGKTVIGDEDDLDVIMPSQVQVFFPKAATSGTGYLINVEADGDPDVDPENHYATRRYHRIVSSAGMPTGLEGNGKCQPALYDSTWAIMDGLDVTPTNSAALITRADEISRIFYSRFKSGACDILFMATLPVVPFSGSQTIEWFLTGSGVYTRVSGIFDFPLFGYTYDQRLTVQDFFSSGGVRAIVRPWGGLLLDAPRLEIDRFRARVNPSDNAVQISTNRWRYAWNEMELNGNVYQVKAGGRSGTTSVDFALNLAEMLNNGAGVESPNINIDGPDYPEGFSIQPYYGGAWMYITTDTEGNVRYEFQASNTDDGTCT